MFPLLWIAEGYGILLRIAIVANECSFTHAISFYTDQISECSARFLCVVKRLPLNWQVAISIDGTITLVGNQQRLGHILAPRSAPVGVVVYKDRSHLLSTVLEIWIRL